MTTKALAKHVMGKHGEFYVRYGNPKEYVAREGQTRADDPEW